MGITQSATKLETKQTHDLNLNDTNTLLIGLPLLLASFALSLLIGSLFLQPQPSKAVTGLSLVSAPTMTLNTSASTVGLTLTPTSTGTLASGSHTLTASTNVPTGYELSLVSTGLSSSSANPASSLAPIAGTIAAPNALTDNTWGYATTRNATSSASNTVINDFDASYAVPTPSNASKWANPTIETTIKDTQASTTSDATTIYYGARVNMDVVAGIHNSTTTYTATTNISNLSAPAIISIKPTSGTTAGGTAIAIVGTDFTVDDQSITTSVTIDGQDCLNVSIVSSVPTVGQDTIHCNTPARATVGAVDVKVETWGGVATVTDGFTYTYPMPAEPKLSPADGAIVNTGTTTITVTSNGATCTWGTSSGSYPNASGTTWATTVGTNTLYYSCIAGSGSTQSEARVGSWSFTGRGTTIQSVTHDNCPNSITPTYDTRDNHYYSVRKLADGKCWMLNNLAYGGNTTGVGDNYDPGVQFTSGAGQSTTTNIAASSTEWNQATPPYNNQKQWVDPTTADVTQYMGTRCATAYRTTAASINYTECGFLYNWCAALGNSNSACNQASDEVANAGVGLCPAGWRLPTRAEYVTMYTAIGGAHANLVGASSTWRGVYSGLFAPNFGLNNQSVVGYYWSAAAASATNGYSFGFSTSRIYPAGSLDKYYGFSVRCIAQVPVAQTGDSIQNITKGTCPATMVNVYDTRDSHYYSVQKLDDGNCWMLTNLAYGGSEAGTQFTSGAGTTVASGDNVASGTVWTRQNPPYNNQKQWVDPTADAVIQFGGIRCATAYRTSAASINYTECGFLYNWCAALGNSSANCNVSSGDVSNAGVGLCPDGWRLPTQPEYATMYTAIGGAHANLVGASSTWRGVYSGVFNPGVGLVAQSDVGYYWSATAASITDGYYLSFGTSSVNPAYSHRKYLGYAVRCVTTS